jgi:hypothetical protein
VLGRQKNAANDEHRDDHESDRPAEREPAVNIRLVKKIAARK